MAKGRKFLERSMPIKNNKYGLNARIAQWEARGNTATEFHKPGSNKK